MANLRRDVRGFEKDRQGTSNAPSNRALKQQLSSLIAFESALKQQLTSLATETAAVAAHVGKATRSVQLDEACKAMESRSNLMTATEESIQKMPAVLSSLEAYLDESIACASDLLHVAPFPLQPPPQPSHVSHQHPKLITPIGIGQLNCCKPHSIMLHRTNRSNGNMPGGGINHRKHFETNNISDRTQNKAT
ncbi:unnamed protein product [Closterium sp. NIES-64]|nr:unnamed protein product [Closterium sp. NIES-64]